jgi:hypothetical protein
MVLGRPKLAIKCSEDDVSRRSLSFLAGRVAGPGPLETGCARTFFILRFFFIFFCFHLFFYVSVFCIYFILYIFIMFSKIQELFRNKKYSKYKYIQNL